MISKFNCARNLCWALTVVGVIGRVSGANGQPTPSGTYHAIEPTMSNTTVMLTGHNLSIEELVQVSRYGAKVQLSPEARQRSLDAYGLLLEAPVEGVSVYLFTRRAGPGRESVILEGDPMAAENKSKLEQKEMRAFQNGNRLGLGPEVSYEEIVRAMMVVRSNTMSYDPASPQLTQMLLDFLNNQISPVVQSMGTTSEGDLSVYSNVAAAMVGKGDVYYRGVRMPAAQALKRAGLKSLQPFAADNETFITTAGYASGQAALLVNDARQMLEWADLIYAMDLIGMNSSITPLSLPVQSSRPLKWLNWDADRVLDMLKGSYLFDDDSKRVIQDPESLRASSIRQASAWQAWAALRKGVLAEINSADHNPVVVVGLSPQDSWELSTPQMMKFYVKGGKNSNGKYGYIVSNANWDPYPFTNEVEGFTIALANMDVAVFERIQRFDSTFFTGLRPGDVLPAASDRLAYAQGGAIVPQGGGTNAVAIWQGVQSLMIPLAPEGSADSTGVADLAAQTVLKVSKARQAVNLTMDLLGQDLLTATLWMDVRKAQDSSRTFGLPATKVWSAFREAVPLRTDPDGSEPIGSVASLFIKQNPAARFYSTDTAIPEEDSPIPIPQSMTEKQ